MKFLHRPVLYTPLSVFLPVLLAALFCSAAAVATARHTAMAALVRLGGVEMWVELAQSDTERSRGLMFRGKPRGNQGMLFVQSTAQFQSFWMKNTPVALSIGFFNRDDRLCNHAVMQPFVLKPVKSVCAGRYALEMRPGWFTDNKVPAGARLEVVRYSPLDRLPAGSFVPLK